MSAAETPTKTKWRLGGIPDGILIKKVARREIEPGVFSGLLSRAHKEAAPTRSMPLQRASDTALGLDLGTIASPANTIRKSQSMTDIALLPAGHTHRLAQMYATDTECSFDCLSGVVHLPRLP